VVETFMTINANHYNVETY